MRSFISAVRYIENQSVTENHLQKFKFPFVQAMAIDNRQHKAEELKKQKIDVNTVNENSYPVPVLSNDAIYHTLSFISQHELARFAGVNRQWNKVISAKTRRIEASMLGLMFYPSREIGIDWIKLCNRINNGSLCSDIGKRLGVEIKYTHEAQPRKIKIISLNRSYHLEGEYGEIYFNFKSNSCNYLDIEFLLRPYREEPLTNNQKSLITALKNNQLNQVRELITFNNANTFDEQGNPILAIAIQNCNIEMVRTLLEYNADIESRTNNNQRTALLEAVMQLIARQTNNEFNEGIMTIIQMLILKGANVNAQAIFGKTLLHYLAESPGQFAERNLKLAKYFIRKGANLLITTYANQAPMDSEKNRVITRFFYASVMHMAQSRVHEWERKDNLTYEIRFKPSLTHEDKVWAWEAIVNKLKSLAVDHALGLASDSCSVSFRNNGIHRNQCADTDIPRRNQYAISKMSCVDDKIDICIDHYLEKYIDEIHATILKAFGPAHLNLKKSQKMLEKENKTNSNQFFSLSSKKLDTKEPPSTANWHYVV